MAILIGAFPAALRKALAGLLCAAVLASSVPAAAWADNKAAHPPAAPAASPAASVPHPPELVSPTILPVDAAPGVSPADAAAAAAPLALPSSEIAAVAPGASPPAGVHHAAAQMQVGVAQAGAALGALVSNEPNADGFAAGRALFDNEHAAPTPAGPEAGIAAASAALQRAASKPPTPGKRAVTFVYDANGRDDVSAVRLKGNFDARTGERDERAWQASTPMAPLGGGLWLATVDLVDDSAPHDWRWGVTLDTKQGADQWGVMEEAPLKLELAPGGGPQQAYYAPTTYHAMGAVRTGDDLSFRIWAPGATRVQAKIVDHKTRAVAFVPLSRGAGGLWSAKLAGAATRLDGSAYAYELTLPDGRTVERRDPYARLMQGKQRGIGPLYIDADTGDEVGPYFFQQEGKRQKTLTRFEIQEREGESLAEAYVVLKDGEGRPLSKTDIERRFGAGDAAAARAFGEAHWAARVEPDGRVKMAYRGGAWISVFDDPQKLLGLRYELQAFTENGAPATSKNDRWSDLIEDSSGKSFRAPLIGYGPRHEWKHDSAPREKNRAKWRFYQIHVGSFMGRAKNARRSTFDDVRRNLRYVKSLGYNTIELLPTTEFEDHREWGYGGSHSLAVESGYGFEDEDGNWVTGLEAMKRLVDEAHRLGLNVVGDVVYNHFGGKYDPNWNVSADKASDNHLWGFDGSANSFFNWGTEDKPEFRQTPWGPLPAYNNPRVRQYLLDHLAYQFQELHLDGARFDFTEPIKGNGGAAGWLLLRQMMRLARFLNMQVFTAAEQFPYDKTLTEDQRPDGSGVGFSALWFTEVNHRLVHESDQSKPSILQQAAHRWRTLVDRFVELLINPSVITGWLFAVSPVTNHDEVGNADRVINIANDGRTDGLWPQFARDAARFALGIGIMSPGMHMIFQGEESLADNRFQWGNPATWDLDWSWLELGSDWDWSRVRFNDALRPMYERLAALPLASRGEDAEFRSLSADEQKLVARLASQAPELREKVLRNVARRQTSEFTRAANALRASTDAFDADASVERVYTHNDHSILAFTRKKGADEFLIVGSLSRAPWDKGYGLPLPGGPWKEVFTSDAERFGGSGVTNAGKTIAGGGWEFLNIPAGGFVVLKKAKTT